MLEVVKNEKNAQDDLKINDKDQDCVLLYSISSRKKNKTTSIHHKQKIVAKEKSRLKEGRWTIEEDQIYMDFIKQNEELFESQHSRRTKRVFDKLSKLLDNGRTAEQCRSHHQKMQKVVQNASIDNIVEYLRKKRLKKTIALRGEVKINEQDQIKGNPTTTKENIRETSTFKISSHHSTNYFEIDIQILSTANFFVW